MPACGEEYERMRKEVNKEVHERIVGMKAESVRKREVGSSFLDMDGLILAEYFSRDGVHLSSEGERKLSGRYISWIKATHILMKSRTE